MSLQELHEEYLLNLLDKLELEIDIRSIVHDPAAEGGDPWEQPMYLIPMWNIIEKIKSFKSYFDEFNLLFPTEGVYRHPINLSTLFPDNMIHIKEEEFIYKGEKIKIEYNYI